MKKLLFVGCVVLLLASADVMAASVAYIHGRVANDGTVLAEGVGSPYDQMLITDSGRTGLSMFRELVISQGHTIEQFRDNLTTLNTAFLNRYDVIIFGLHQKIWSSTEKNALDSWLRGGGGMFIYSDSASGGFFREVGAQNPVGQTVTNNLIARYGMQATAQTANSSTSISLINDLRLEGEGVSPVAVAQNDPNVEILIPYTRNIRHTQNISITNPQYASLALRPVGQPMWNNGPGSDIEEQDNTTILREVVNFLAARPIGSGPGTPPSPGTPNDNPVITPVLILLSDD